MSEIDWGAVVGFLKDNGWDVQQHLAHDLLTNGAPWDQLPSFIQQVVLGLQKEGLSPQEIIENCRYTCVVALKFPTCAAGCEHSFLLDIDNHGAVSVSTEIYSGDVEHLPDMFEHIEKRLELHEREDCDE